MQETDTPDAEKPETPSAEAPSAQSHVAEAKNTEWAPPTSGQSLKQTRARRARMSQARRPSANRTFMPAEDAAGWFVGDLLEVSGYMRPGVPRYRSGYAHYRPLLTAPDPWYFAGLVALEASKIVDVFPKAKADAVMREVLAQADAATEKHDVAVSRLVQGVMGRLGMGAILLQAKVPDILISKVMRMLLGSHRNAARLIPSQTAHEQVTSALKLGRPVWWRMFIRHYDVRLPDEVIETPDLGPLRPIPPEPILDEPMLEEPLEVIPLQEDTDEAPLLLDTPVDEKTASD